MQPVIALFQDAIALRKHRDELAPKTLADQQNALEDRLDALIYTKPEEPDCRRICNRLAKHRSELLLFLDGPQVPPDNNAGERDIRSVAAARADGGVNRTDRGAKVFAAIKTVARTCRKQGLNFFDFALATLGGIPPPLQLATHAP